MAKKRKTSTEKFQPLKKSKFKSWVKKRKASEAKRRKKLVSRPKRRTTSPKMVKKQGPLPRTLMAAKKLPKTYTFVEHEVVPINLGRADILPGLPNLSSVQQAIEKLFSETLEVCRSQLHVARKFIDD